MFDPTIHSRYCLISLWGDEYECDCYVKHIQMLNKRIEKLERDNEYLRECVDGWSRHSEILACQRDEMARVIADCDGMSCRQYRAIGK